MASTTPEPTAVPAAPPTVRGVEGTVATNVRGVVLDGAGHWLPDEQPDALSALLLHFPS